MECESGVTRNITDDLLSSDIQQDKTEQESGVIRTIIDELLLRISNKIKRNRKVLLFELSLMNFSFGYPTRSNAR